MGRLRIMVRGVEQCVRLIWSVIVLRWSYTDFRFRAMPCIKSSQIDSSRAVAGRRLVYGGHDDAGVYHTTSVDPHACSKSCVELYPRLVFFYVLLSSRKTPDIYPSSRALGAAPAPTASRGAAMQCRRLRLGGCIRNILLIEVILDGHVGCGTATRGAAHLPQTYFVVSSELEWRPMA